MQDEQKVDYDVKSKPNDKATATSERRRSAKQGLMGAY